jgi:hypothetical protein
MPFEHNFPNLEKVELKFVPNGIQNHYKHTNPTIDPFKFWKKLRVTKLNMFFPYKLGEQWTPSMSKSPNPNTYKIDPSPHTHVSPHNFFSCLSTTCQIIWPKIFIGIKKTWELLQVVSLIVMAFFIITFLNFKFL